MSQEAFSVTDLAWAAGILDGEGCISLRPHLYQGQPSSWRLEVSVVNTNPIIIDRLKAIFGIGYIGYRKSLNAKWKPRWVWQVAAKQAEIVLEVLSPYLVGKTEQARIGLLSRRLLRPQGTNTFNPNHRELLWLKKELNNLNARGPLHGSNVG